MEPNRMQAARIDRRAALAWAGAFAASRRRVLLAAWTLLPFSATAQPARTPKVALLFTTALVGENSGSADVDPGVRAFVQGLEERGYIDGRNVTVVVRSAGGDLSRLPHIVRQLVEDKVDVIVTSGPGVRAAREVTQTIPIVGVVDTPVESGLASTFAKPGGNITGFTIVSDVAMMLGKRLQLLKEVVPRARRVAVIDFKYIDPIQTAGPYRRRQAIEPIARDLGLTVVHVGITEEADVQPALAAIDAARVDMLMVLNTPVTDLHKTRIIAFTTDRRLPSIHDAPVFVRAGALMSYSTAEDVGRRSAAYVDKILKGAKPGDLPFEQPMQYSLAINRTTAKAIGIEIPRATLLRADLLVD
jgi:putative ABC transport system substrate-binding protein